MYAEHFDGILYKVVNLYPGVISFGERLALRFRGLTIPAAPVHDYNGDLVGDSLPPTGRVRSLGSLYSVTGLAHWYIVHICGFLLSRV